MFSKNELQLILWALIFLRDKLSHPNLEEDRAELTGLINRIKDHGIKL
jgi:hypothetical protein